MTKKRAFISYAREDSEWAARLVTELQRRNIRTWFDRENLLPGQDWDREIKKAIDESRFFLAILSHHSVSKQGIVQREVNRALGLLSDYPEGSVYIVPVRIDDCVPSSSILAKLQWLDLFNDWEEGIERLLKVISEESPGPLEIDNLLKQGLGRFRHAILGPIQGLSSAAKLLVSIAREGGAEPDIVEGLSCQIDRELETIRLWRENQALFMSNSPALILRSQPLQLTIGRVIARFTSILSDRAMTLDVLWHTSPEFVCHYDSRVLDLIVSNLLDNAGKYGFFNRPVTLGIEREGSVVRIFVENIGHALPASMQYTLDTTAKEQRLNSALHGEGLGLKVVQSLAAAHGGRLFCESWAIAEGKTLETTPHKVRFAVTLECKDRGARAYNLQGG